MPASSSLLTVTLLSSYRFFVSIQFPWTSYDSGFVYFLFILVLPISIPVSFRSNLFPSLYWSYSGTSLFVQFYFSFTVLLEDGPDDSSELVSHQMAHPSLCRTRFPS